MSNALDDKLDEVYTEWGKPVTSGVTYRLTPVGQMPAELKSALQDLFYTEVMELINECESNDPDAMSLELKAKAKAKWGKA